MVKPKEIIRIAGASVMQDILGIHAPLLMTARQVLEARHVRMAVYPQGQLEIVLASVERGTLALYAKTISTTARATHV